MYNRYLETDRLLLVTAERGMARQILDFYIRNEEHLAPWEDKREQVFFTLDYQRALIRSEQKHLRRGAGIDFWMLEKDGGKLVGKIAVFSISSGNLASCMVGYKLDKNSQSKGYMHEALDAVADFLFEDINLHRIEICIVPRNTRSVNVAERAGFVCEGIRRNFMRINGVWEDHAVYVKINQNYREV